MPDPDRPIVIGRVTRAYGLAGWVKVASFTRPPENLIEYRPWLLADRGGRNWQEAEIREIRQRGEGFVARFEGCEDRDAAEALARRDIAVPRSRLPAPEAGSYYWFDLVGLTVETTAGVHLGRVARIQETGANDVLVVRGADRERLIPFVHDFVPEVDLEAGILRTEWDPDF